MSAPTWCTIPRFSIRCSTTRICIAEYFDLYCTTLFPTEGIESASERALLPLLKHQLNEWRWMILNPRQALPRRERECAAHRRYATAAARLRRRSQRHRAATGPPDLALRRPFFAIMRLVQSG